MGIGPTQSNMTRRPGAAARPTKVSDQLLVRAMAEGDRRALEILYVRHRARILRFLLRLMGSETAAEEIVNEVFLEAWRRAASFEGRSQVATWLMAIARFRAITEGRRRADAQLDEGAAALIEDSADAPSIVLEKQQRSDILQRCLGKLTPLHREVLTQIYYQDKKVDEVARFTGAPINTIKTRMHHARNRMAELLAEAGVDQAWMAI
jgi:RNA polymerase sigma-70 factor (ECF subfamily)